MQRKSHNVLQKKAPGGALSPYYVSAHLSCVYCILYLNQMIREYVLSSLVRTFNDPNLCN